MARLAVTVCDRCGVSSEPGQNNSAVTEWSARRSGLKMSGDLCERCWNELVLTFKPSRILRNRGKINVVDITAIPRTGN
jgi:hypothetical protein